MKKLENALRTCRKFYQTYEKQIKIAVIAIVVITALLLFGRNGENDEIIVEQVGEPETELQIGETGIAGSDSEEAVSMSSTAIKLVVDISGCIKTPGVYEIADGTRLHEVIELAGGLTKEADIDAINQAELVTDGQKILIPAKAEEYNSGNKSQEMTTTSDKININTADKSTLCRLPGIGESKAGDIITYREKYGMFQKKEDIMKVTGIKESLYEQICDLICVR